MNDFLLMMAGSMVAFMGLVVIVHLLMVLFTKGD